MSQSELLRLSLSLVVVVVLILFAAWLARRSGLLRRKNQDIRIVAHQSLGARSSIMIVEVEQQRLVLGVTPQSINLLHQLPPHSSFEKQLDQAKLHQSTPPPSENTPS